jgi:hypothetical protein
MKTYISTFLPNWKSIVYLFIPGWIGFIPFIILIYHFKISLGLSELFLKFEYLFIFCIINSILVGLLLNEIGSWIEGWFDIIIECKDEFHNANWKKYLLLEKSKIKKIIIHDVINDVVIRMKFGINFSISLIFLMVLFPLFKIQNVIIWDNSWLILFELVLFLIVIFQLKTALYMSKGLNDYRKDLLSIYND